MPNARVATTDVASLASVLAACLPVLHRALDRRVARDYQHPKPPEGQLALLRLVALREGITVREAADTLLMKPNNVSALVGQLTEQQLIERRQDPADKRVAHLYPTATARQRVSEVRALEAAHLADALGHLTDGELDALGSAMGALTALTDQLGVATG